MEWGGLLFSIRLGLSVLCQNLKGCIYYLPYFLSCFVVFLHLSVLFRCFSIELKTMLNHHLFCGFLIRMSYIFGNIY